MFYDLEFMKDSTLETLKRIINEQLGIERDQITPEAKLIKDFGADSLDALEMVMAIEEEYGFEILDSAWDEKPDISVEEIGAYIDEEVLNR